LASFHDADGLWFIAGVRKSNNISNCQYIHIIIRTSASVNCPDIILLSLNTLQALIFQDFFGISSFFMFFCVSCFTAVKELIYISMK